MDNPVNFVEFLEPEIKIKNNHWSLVFSWRNPEYYQKIRNIMKIDPSLRTPRYIKNWKELYLGYNKMDTYLIGMVPEVKNLYYSIEFFETWPQFYLRIMNLPGIFNRGYFYDEFKCFQYDLNSVIIPDLMEYYTKGVLDRHIGLYGDNNKYIRLPYSVLLFMLEDYPDIVKDNYQFIQFTLYKCDLDVPIERYIVQQIIKRLPEDLIEIIEEYDDKYVVEHSELDLLIQKMRYEKLIKLK